MADQELRARWRIACASGDVEDEARVLVMRSRVGDVAAWAIDLAVALDHPAALRFMGAQPFPIQPRHDSPDMEESDLTQPPVDRRNSTVRPPPWGDPPVRFLPSGLITSSQRLQLELVTRALRNAPPAPTWHRFAAGLAATTLVQQVETQVYRNDRHEGSLDSSGRAEVRFAIEQCLAWIKSSQHRIRSVQCLPLADPLMVWRTLNLCGSSSVIVSEFCLLEVLLIAAGYLGHRCVMETLRSTIATWALGFDMRNLGTRLPNSMRVRNVRHGRISVASGGDA